MFRYTFLAIYTACKTAHPLSAVSCCVLFLAVIICLILSYSVLSVHNTCHSA
nr:MAG TPA: hypothetical protein [Caudoviricetes sp.]